MEKKTEYILRQGVQSSSRQKFRLIVTPEFDNKIKWLCLHSDNKEWSGIMYYKVEGTFETGMKFTPLNLLLMDLGSAGSTSYDESPDMASFLCDHPELISEDVQQGLIHSHNVMRAFFSEIDETTLKLEGTDRNHFLSLIVNNDGEYVARVTRKCDAADKITRNLDYETYGGKSVNVPMELERTIHFVEWFDVEISSNAPQYELRSRIGELKANAAAKEAALMSCSQGIYAPRVYNSYSGESWYDRNNFQTPAKQAPVKVEKGDKPAVPKPSPNSVFQKAGAVPEETFLQKEAKRLVMQLLTGNISVSEASGINMPNWVKNMPNLFSKRFADIKGYSDYISSYSDFLIDEWVQSNEDSVYEDPGCLNSLIDEMIILLESYGENDYVEAVKDALTTYYYDEKELEEDKDLPKDTEEDKE